MYYNLSSSQYNFYPVNIEDNLWNQSGIILFKGFYAYEQMNSSLNSIISADDFFRCRFKEVSDKPVTYIDEFSPTDFPYFNFESEEALYEIVAEYKNHSLADRLFEAFVFNLHGNSGFFANFHHLIIDGYSMTVMAEHLNICLNGETVDSNAVSSYQEYVDVCEKYKNSKRYTTDRTFWSKQFSLNPNCSIFEEKKTSFDYASDEVNFRIGTNLFDNIKSFCDNNNMSVQSFFNTVYSVYIYRTLGVDLFTLGVPVLNRTTEAELNTIGLYMHIVPLVVKISNESFLKNALNIEDAQMTLFRHQKFTQHDIKDLLKEQGNPQNALFDIATDYQEFSENEDYEFEFIYSNSLSLPLEIHMQSFGKEKHNLKIRYRTSMFSEKEIQTMLDSFMAIAEDALENPDKKITELEMLSAEEKQRIVYDFNNTAVSYSKDKCIHELFEEQAEKTPDKVAVVATDKTLTYRELNEEANRIAHSLVEKGIGKGDIVAFMLPRKSSLIAVMLGVLKSGAAYLPVDPDHPRDRIEYMLSDSGAKNCITEKNLSEFLESSDISNPGVCVSGTDICYCIYTSGSTGKPKGTLVTQRNITNYVHNNSNNVVHRIIKEDCRRIISVTTVGFDIFVTESLLPLANGMEIVFADENQAKIQSKLNELIKKIPVDVLQTTPTKMKSLIADKKQTEYLRNLKTVILGGETLNASLVEELKAFTDAEIFNIYGPTETTVWVTNTKVNSAEDITIGKPMANTQIYIVDKHLKPVPIGITGELCIAGDGIGAGYLNNPELTAEKFIDNPFGEGKLYKTGDLAYWREDGNIVFIGRNDFQVKIRGLRIELGEIENAILSVDGVVQCAVVVRKDSEDRQFICAFYTGEEKTSGEIRKVIGEKLPKYMIPHVFTYLDEMPLTSSGKINRKALPEIDLQNIETSVEYVAPETEKEIALTECISEVLNIEKISVLDNFFDIGGDSLKAIELTAKLESRGYTTVVKTIFESKDIRELAEEIAVGKTEYVKAEYGNTLPATAAQMRVYTSQSMKPDSAHYNIPAAFNVKELDADRLEQAVNSLIERHESLRTRFENRDGQIVQVIDNEATVKIEKLSGNDISLFNTPFDLSEAPLIKVGYYENTVMLVTHHIIADGESMNVLYRELNELYMGRELKETVQYGEFAVSDGYTEENEDYWLNVFKEAPAPLELRTDFARPEQQSFVGSQLYELIDINIHNRINHKCKELGITPYVYYMACFSVLLSKYSGKEDIVVGTPISGRSSRYLDTVGMFVNTIALRSRPEGNKLMSELLEEIRSSSIEAIDNQNYPIGELIKKLGINISSANPLLDVMLVYQSEKSTSIIFGDSEAEMLPVALGGVKCDINLSIMPRETDVVLMAEYCTEIYRRETLEKLIKSYISILEQASEEDIYIKDISVMSEAERKLLYDFNNTEHNYSIPDNSTLFSLFEKTAEENKEKVCIKTAEGNLTFGELRSASENLDARLREITGNKKSVVAVIAERSPEMYAAIYGIIRGGNAYLPIDPKYPQDRIEYILKNSNAAAVVAQKKLIHLASDVPAIDMTAFLDSSCKENNIPICAAEPDDTAYVIYTSGSTGNPKGARISHKSAINRILWMHDKYPLGINDVILQKTPYTFDVSVWELFWWAICGGGLAASKPDEHFLPAKIIDEVYNNKVTHLHFVPSVFELFLSFLESNEAERSKFETVKYVFLSGEALSASLVQRFYDMYDCNKVTLHNLYGPTECAVDVTYYDCMPADIDPVPIGKPIYNTQMYVVDKYNNPVPMGVAGELCIAGVNVGQGYLNNPELTAEKFIDNPFGEGKLYKTGDLACWREDGNIVFIGRIDHQIKLGGQRIEIGEIESVISEVDGIESVAVVINKTAGREMLVAFFTGKDDNNTIKEMCLSKLPRYMVPGAFVHLEKLPLNQSGKLDRKALSSKTIEFAQFDEGEAPINDTERFICELFGKTLGKEGVGRHSDFFELGGTSLSMISLISEKEFENISAADFVRNSTPYKLSLLMNDKNEERYEYLEALYVNKDTDKVMILLPFAGGGAEAYSRLVNSIKERNSDRSLYFIRYLHSTEECRKAASEIAEAFSGKQINFYSHCVGSAIALQIIRELEACGVNVKNYFAGASIPPAKPTIWNVWNSVPDKVLTTILSKAGAQLSNLPQEILTEMLKSFRKDTDFAGVSYCEAEAKIKAPVTVILSKKDIFTKNYRQTEKCWSLYAENIKGIRFIDSKSHYFQSDDAEALINQLDF